LYFERHDGQAATIEQFLACFGDATGRDLTQFHLWYTQAGTPEVAVTSDWDAANGTLTLNIVQTVPQTPGQDHKSPMVIPLAFGLVGADGADLPATCEQAENGLLVLTRNQHRFPFAGLQQPPAISINRNFSAPIKLT